MCMYVALYMYVVCVCRTVVRTFLDAGADKDNWRQGLTKTAFAAVKSNGSVVTSRLKTKISSCGVCPNKS